MKKIVIFCACFSIFLASACTPYKTMTPEGEALKMVDSKPAGCKSLGDITTEDMALPQKESMNWIRNRAAKEGADTFRIEREGKLHMGGIVIGSNDYYFHKAYIYKCGK